MRKIVVIVTFLVFNSFMLLSQESAKTYNEGIRQIKSKNFSTALELLEEAISMAVDEQGYAKNYWYYAAADAALYGKNYEKAVEYYGKALDNNYNKAKVYRKLATAYKEKGNEEDYLATLQKGLEKYPADFELVKDLGLFYYNKGAKIQGEAAKIAESNPEQCKLELKDAKEEFKQAKPYLEKANKNVESMISKTSSQRKKAAYKKDQEIVETALAQIDTALDEINIALNN